MRKFLSSFGCHSCFLVATNISSNGLISNITSSQLTCDADMGIDTSTLTFDFGGAIISLFTWPVTSIHFPLHGFFLMQVFINQRYYLRLSHTLCITA
ncbi:hypothetical protein [uncultured Paraglaciecola sp.]|jgi:hypothetical protein|uniref:hypothetical protein n=1 Tax=uncultured Paraglaciecola sp. TaxID=1765024 RepID=UPI002631DCDC|nr:hypothetical protein [uncultured Paraglaciecola sp.]